MAKQLIKRLKEVGMLTLVFCFFSSSASGQVDLWLRWQSFEAVSKFDDTPIYILGVSAAGPLLGAGALLRLRCDEGIPSANFFLMNMIASNRTSSSVRYRVDAQTALTEKLWVGEASDMLSFPNDTAARKFSRSLLGAKKLIVQIQPVGDPLYLATFNVEGLAEIAGPMRQACNW